MVENQQKTESLYVFLDFNDQLTTKTFEKKVFFRVANLHKPNPLVQVNDLVFKGHYEESVGTNLFFEEVENPLFKSHAFEKDTPIKLRLRAKQTKVIKLQQMRFPRCSPAAGSNEELLELDLKQDYNTVLGKLENGTLDLEGMLKKTILEDHQKLQQPILSKNEESSRLLEIHKKQPIEPIKTDSVVDAKYERLRKLARKPVRRAKSPELKSGSDPKYQANYDFNNLKCLVLRENFVEDSVDANRSALYRLIEPLDNPSRQLTEEELDKTITIDNFQNLSLKSRYLILKECLKYLGDGDEGRDVIAKLVEACEQRLATKDGKIKIEKRKHKDFSGNYSKFDRNCAEDLVGDIPEIYNRDEWEGEFRENWGSEGENSD